MLCHSQGSGCLVDTPSRSFSSTLLSRLRDPRDQEAWQKFDGRYRSVVLGWAGHLLQGLGRGDAQRAEDITQDVLASLVRTFQEFEYDRTRSFRGWLHRVTQNACISACRRKELVGASLDDVAERAAADDLVARLRENFDIEVFEAACERVRERIDQHGEPHTWEAFRLSLSPMLGGEGQSVADASERLGITPGSVEKAVSNIKKMLTEEIARLDPQTP